MNNETRRLVIKTLEAQNEKAPHLTNQIIRESLSVFLRRPSEKTSQNSDEQQRHASKRHSHLGDVLLACATFNDDISASDKKSLLAKMLLLSHVPDICKEPNFTGYGLHSC